MNARSVHPAKFATCYVGTAALGCAGGDVLCHGRADFLAPQDLGILKPRSGERIKATALAVGYKKTNKPRRGERNRSVGTYARASTLFTFGTSTPSACHFRANPSNCASTFSMSFIFSVIP
jgi:hypothetical protein